MHLHHQTFTPGGQAAAAAAAVAAAQQQQQQQQPPVIPEMHFSARHNGLYLFFSRLIRPVWLATLVTPARADAAGQQLSSNVSSGEAEWIMAQLNDLKVFLEKNAQFAASAASTGAAAAAAAMGVGEMGTVAGQQQRSQQEALLRERQSLLFLQHLVSHCLQVNNIPRKIVNYLFDNSPPSIRSRAGNSVEIWPFG